MREVELKAVLDDWARRGVCLTQAGAVLTFAGRLEDRRYDTPRRDLARRDEVLRLRVYRDASGARAELGWKGPTGYDGGYKVRDELQCRADAPDVLATMLGRLGYEVTRAIDREIAQFELDGTIVRFERYPRMDDLVEVEGLPIGIERAILALGMDRSAFSTERLPQFVMRWQRRTGQEPALCDDEMTGRARYALEDA